MKTRTALQTLRDREQAERAAANPRGVTELDEMIDAYDERDNARWRHDRLLDILRHIADRLPLYPRTGTTGPQVVSLPGESPEEHVARQAERDAEGAHVSAAQEEKARRTLGPECADCHRRDGAHDIYCEFVGTRKAGPPAEDRSKPPPGWKIWPWASKSWAYGRQGEADARNVFPYNDDAIAACWAEVDREREKSIADTSNRPRDLDEAADDRPYFVELENAESGCEHCGSGRIWGVMQPDGFMRGQMFGNEEDAIDLAEAMNDAYEAALSGEAERTRKAVDAAIAEDRADVQRSNEDPVLDAQFRSALAQRAWLAGKAATAAELAFAICPDQAGGHEMALALIDHARRIGANEERERLAKLAETKGGHLLAAAQIRKATP